MSADCSKRAGFQFLTSVVKGRILARAFVIVPTLSYSRSPDQLEDGHRRHITSKKRQWAATAEAEEEGARASLKSEMERTRASHSHEITKLEGILKDAKAQLKQAVAETEEAKEATKAELYDLESTLTGLRRRVVDGKRSFEENQQAARKVAEAEVLQEDKKLRIELMRVAADLEDERKHVAELEGQLKKAKSRTKTLDVQAKDGFSQTTHGPDIGDSGTVAKAALLEDELALLVRENENLRSQVSRVSDQRGDACMPTCLAEAPNPELKEMAGLKRELEEADIKLLAIHQAKTLAEQVTDGCVIVGHTPHVARQANVLPDWCTFDFQFYRCDSQRTSYDDFHANKVEATSKGSQHVQITTGILYYYWCLTRAPHYPSLRMQRSRRLHW